MPGEDFAIGYGRGEVEPHIAPLVRAIRATGFETFSSCEGHITEAGESRRFPSVGFFAHEDAARRVHEILVRSRDTLACCWSLRGGFVARRGTDEWTLGWTLENGGIIEPAGDPDWAQFAQQTLDATRQKDIPSLVEMFREFRAPAVTPE
jgi:hypothetical protein